MSGGRVRAPAMAGMFYPAEKGRLLHLIDGLCPRPLPEEEDKEEVRALLVPHAGYMYSGRVAASVYSRVRFPKVVVVLCFNHGGHGSTFSLWPGPEWLTPLGPAPIHDALTRRLKVEFPKLEEDARAHEGEHSGEVQIPFLQYFRPDVEILPVSLNSWRDEQGFSLAVDLGEALARAVEGMEPAPLVVASSDLNHYEREDTTHEKDRIAMEAITTLDPAVLRDAVQKEKISMCGFAPTVAAMAYARRRGGSEGRVLTHATSGDVTGDRDRVVGYAGIIFP